VLLILLKKNQAQMLSFTKSFKNIASQMMITEKELKKKTTSGLKSSKVITTSILQDQTTMSEDHLHRTIKSIKLRMITIQ
jgi:hypothetical protein